MSANEFQSDNFTEAEVENESFIRGKENYEEEDEEIGNEWWDRNWVWYHRSPYVTGALMDKLEPYIKKLETTDAWQAYDKYLRSVGPHTDELSLEERWKIARKWYEREDPKAFWDNVYAQEEKKKKIKRSMSKVLQKRYKDNIRLSTLQ